MTNIPTRAKDNINNKKLFSLKNGFKFFVSSNILIVCFIGIFIINNGAKVPIISFTVFAEIFLVLLSVIACLKPGKPKENESKGIERQQSKELLGALIAFVFLSLFSLLFLGANIPYPSTLIFFMLISNAMVSAYSILFHPIALGLYEANVFQRKTTMFDYIFKYIAIFLSGISYYVQRTLFKLPLLLNKLIVIAFVLLLLWQWFMMISIFEN